ncbi:UNVERIFIED_CONTAM: hypothetical protein HHA_221905 [Hammondia hammondi]|eukprot:XP_008886242.1 hypothetical protein HHA_221905 [Hammondia hammondi]
MPPFCTFGCFDNCRFSPSTSIPAIRVPLRKLPSVSVVSFLVTSALCRCFLPFFSWQRWHGSRRVSWVFCSRGAGLRESVLAVFLASVASKSGRRISETGFRRFRLSKESPDCLTAELFSLSQPVWPSSLGFAAPLLTSTCRVYIPPTQISANVCVIFICVYALALARIRFSACVRPFFFGRPGVPSLTFTQLSSVLLRRPFLSPR